MKLFNEKAKEGPINLGEIDKEAMKRFEAYKLSQKLLEDPNEKIIDSLTNSLKEQKFDLHTFIKAAAKDPERNMAYVQELQKRHNEILEKKERSEAEEEELKRLILALAFFALGYIERQRKKEEAEKNKEQKSLWDLLIVLVQQLISEMTNMEQYTKSGVPQQGEKPKPVRILVADQQKSTSEQETN